MTTTSTTRGLRGSLDRPVCPRDQAPGEGAGGAGRGGLRRWRVAGVLTLILVMVWGAVLAPAAIADPAPPAPPVPGPPSSPCTGPDCIPQPTAPTPLTTGLVAGPPAGSGWGGAECGVTSLGGCVTNAINAFFRGLVADALNPLLEVLSRTVLTTPSPQDLPRVGELWNQSWQILLACYGLVVMIAGLLLMAYESVQAHYSVKEIAPRLVVGFLAGALSLFVTTQAISLANALSQAVMSGGVEEASAADTLKNMILATLGGGGIFFALLGLLLAAAVLVLLITYIVRVAVTIILVVGAPLAMMCHGTPQSEPIAYWWWKAFGGCLAVQLAQSLTWITSIRVFLAPGGFTLISPTPSGLVNLIVALGLMYILIKIPFWILGSLRVGGRRSLIGGLARAYLVGRTLGLLRR
jgi:hypothetical protein